MALTISRRRTYYSVQILPAIRVYVLHECHRTHRFSPEAALPRSIRANITPSVPGLQRPDALHAESPAAVPSRVPVHALFQPYRSMS